MNAQSASAEPSEKDAERQKSIAAASGATITATIKDMIAVAITTGSKPGFSQL
jgi:hypothetical protein